MNNARSKASGQFQPNRSDAGHRRPSQQQQAERRAEIARLSEQVKQTADSAGQRMQQQAAAPVAVETSDLMLRHEERMRLMRERAGL